MTTNWTGTGGTPSTAVATQEIANLIQAIKDKVVGSAFNEDLGGRFYFDQADDNGAPYCVFSIISSVPDKTFSETCRNVLIQFSIFVPKTQGLAVMTTAYSDMHALFDECSLLITGSTLVVMREQSLNTFVEEGQMTDGSDSMIHWAADYEVVIGLN
jgi:hypothetical protein